MNHNIITEEGSVRVDFVGGTLDLFPLNLIIPHVVTINGALSLKAKVKLEKNDQNFIEIYSGDYNKGYIYQECEFSKENLFYTNFFQEMTFICQILDLFKIHKGLKITLSSGSPPGAGLGGSSTMGVVLYKALCRLNNINEDHYKIVRRVQATEARILCRGVAGYQDYFPALIGGVLAIHPALESVEIEQLYSLEMVSYLEKHTRLIYSGLTRNSGINNWQVYKNYFEHDEATQIGLHRLAQTSFQAYQAMKTKDFSLFISKVIEEGKIRKNLFSGIVTPEIEAFTLALAQDENYLGMRPCGAGGGGCFLVFSSTGEFPHLNALLDQFKMKELPFSLEMPL